MQTIPSSAAAAAGDNDDDDGQSQPKWICDMEDLLIQHPQAIVGEIGLDGFRYKPSSQTTQQQQKELLCPMEKQVLAFEYQLRLAAKLQRPVSIHTVQCFGPLMDVLSKLKKFDQHNNNKTTKKQKKKNLKPANGQPSFVESSHSDQSSSVRKNNDNDCNDNSDNTATSNNIQSTKSSSAMKQAGDKNKNSNNNNNNSASTSPPRMLQQSIPELQFPDHIFSPTHTFDFMLLLAQTLESLTLDGQQLYSFQLLPRLKLTNQQPTFDRCGH